MKRFLLSITGITAMALLLGTGAMAQDKEKNKNKLGDNDEIVIRKKGDKDGKVTIEIKDGNVTVNGKPLDEYDGDDLVIRKNRRGTGVYMATPGSPFRSGTYSFNNNDDFFGNTNENKAFLGVVTEEAEGGVKVEEVTDGSAAEKAGLKEGDVITMVGDKKVEDPDDLTKAIGKYKPDDKVTVTYKRDGKEQKVTATLGKRKSNTYSYNTMPRIETPRFDFGEGGQMFSFNSDRPRLGIRAQDTEDDKGAKVIAITSDESPAHKAGIEVGDVITEFDGKAVKNADDLAGAARDARDKASVKATLSRDGKSQTVEIKTPKKLKTENL
jgi:serine protease Do